MYWTFFMKSKLKHLFNQFKAFNESIVLILLYSVLQRIECVRIDFE